MAGAVAERWAHRSVVVEEPDDGRLIATRIGELPALVLEVLGHGVVVVDRDERVVLVNPAARSLGVLAGDRLAFADLANLVRTATDSGPDSASCSRP